MRDILGALAVCILGVLTLMGVAIKIAVKWNEREWR
jgi:hypothetical protein